MAAAIAGTPSSALECPNGSGVYRGTTTTTHELRFAGQDGGFLILSKGKARAVYPFTLTYSNGLARTYLVVTGKDAPSSVMMEFGPDFAPSKEKGSAPFIVTPELTAGFYYWDAFRSRDQNELLPDSAWRLAGCSPDRPTKGGVRP
ncbi:hypothetical protein [Methylobacterium sp. E-016]|uniref:hypothetical protein n=1 Tax=Methylobacterium sp. E-016 TaxID=2836556 RepID=UPI001FBBF146|nr:hypothetical protein [Methylobacterium sp. E-016]